MMAGRVQILMSDVILICRSNWIVVGVFNSCTCMENN